MDLPYVSQLLIYTFLSLLVLGFQIQLRVDIDEKAGSAVLDFAGTGPEVRGNLNAPISVVHSAVIYCMRSMLNADIPLNAGCLVPVDSKFPLPYAPNFKV
jgi:5-oxoprolinase (ATP-hydrolysing)